VGAIIPSLLAEIVSCCLFTWTGVPKLHLLIHVHLLYPTAPQKKEIKVNFVEIKYGQLNLIFNLSYSFRRLVLWNKYPALRSLLYSFSITTLSAAMSGLTILVQRNEEGLKTDLAVFCGCVE
jgi:hypothetical protein